MNHKMIFNMQLVYSMNTYSPLTGSLTHINFIYTIKMNNALFYFSFPILYRNTHLCFCAATAFFYASLPSLPGPRWLAVELVSAAQLVDAVIEGDH